EATDRSDRGELDRLPGCRGDRHLLRVDASVLGRWTVVHADAAPGGTVLRPDGHRSLGAPLPVPLLGGGGTADLDGRSFVPDLLGADGRVLRLADVDRRRALADVVLERHADDRHRG